MTKPEPSRVRRSVIAGSWYPGSEPGLRRAVDEYLAGVDQPLVAGALMGLISPHAGYEYSGQTAAFAYRQLEGREVDTVVIMAPSHRAWLDPFAVSGEDAYATPLGLVPVDQDFIAEMARLVRVQRIYGDAEHSLEIQLPFLQRQLADFRLVPILVSTDEPEVAERLAAVLVEVILQRSQGRRTLLVASSDMHHIDNYEEVVRRDQAVIDAIAAYDLKQVSRLLMDRHCSVCGRMPILMTLHASRLLGADTVKVLHHTNSGEVTGLRRPGQYTVGYMAAAIYKAL